ncbi:MAG: orotidine-5'-phosphate decarboxylase [Chloroflexota bacterium]|nr:orotidine-5'-phosphate decarboxylase [Chloroflexota bacterium]
MSAFNGSSFVEKLNAAVIRNNSLLCLGLDPNPLKYPDHFSMPAGGDALLAWGQQLIDKTADLVCCYKPNIAFYEQFGPSGIEALRRTIASVPRDIPVLLDAKRGDIGSTARAYARAVFDVLEADAVTVSPYLGRDAVTPFLAYAGKAVFVLVYTSNPSARSVQEFGAQDSLLYQHVVSEAKTWGDESQVGFVVGATQPQALAEVRSLLSGRANWILAPGVGAQGGNLSEALSAGLDADGQGMIVPVSRAILYADDPRSAALALREEINLARARVSTHHKYRTVYRPAGEPSIPKAADQVTVDHSELILALHDAGCVQLGQFTLASGQWSPIYVDLRRMSSNPDLLRLAARAYADLLKPLAFDHLAAVPYAALTIGTAVALQTDSSLIYPRKEVKGHGTGRTVEGVFSTGQRAVVVEDLVTSGGSVLKAIDALEGAGLFVSDIVVLIDREQGGQENLATAGYCLHTVLTLSQILTVLQREGRLSPDQAREVQAYLAE